VHDRHHRACEDEHAVDEGEEHPEPDRLLGDHVRLPLHAFEVALQPIRFWMLLAFVHGVFVLAGAVMTIVHLLTLRPAGAAEPASARA